MREESASPHAAKAQTVATAMEAQPGSPSPHAPQVQVVEGGRGADALRRVAEAVKAALRERAAGSQPRPLFLVSPGTDQAEAAREAAGIPGDTSIPGGSGVPNGTGFFEGTRIPAGTGLLMRTSGSTTGTGKIVALSWKALDASAQATASALDGEGTWLSALPLHHIAGFQTVARTLASGRRPVWVDLEEGAALRSQLTQLRSDCPADPIYLSVVPTQLARILDSAALTQALAGVVLLIGGAHTDPALLERAEKSFTCHTSYGMTETCGGCVYDGLPIGDTQIQLAENGQITLTGSVVGLGYLGGERFAGTHTTMDAGRMVDGKLEVLGRLDDAITTGGLTIMPKIVEDVIAKMGWRNVVVGVEHPKWGEAAVAVVDDTGQTAESCSATFIRSFVKLKLGAGWAPTFVIGLSHLGGEWPLTSSGKISRRKLADMAQEYVDV